MNTLEWHSLTIPELTQRLETTTEGLSSAEAARRLKASGPNDIVHRVQSSALRIFLTQFRSPLIAILAVAAGISYVVGEHTDSLVIFGVVILNAGIGLWQERKAGRAMEQLRQLTPQQVHVLRDSVEHTLSSSELVPGDAVVLETGDVVAADGRLTETINLKMNEAVFTGESQPAEKQADPMPLTTPLMERRNAAWRGTTVVSGRGRMVVVATGMHSRFGEIVRTVGATPHSATPFQKNLGSFSKKLTGLIFVLGLIVFMLGVFRSFPANEIFLLSVSLVVSLIPEGLPVVITLTLAWAMRQMAQRRALLRKLTAVEGLGSVTTIAADKTGTLTFGEMMVEEIFAHGRLLQVTGEGYSPKGDFFHEGQLVDPLRDSDMALALKVGFLCNDSRFVRGEGDAEQAIGDPTELALVVAAQKAGLRTETLQETFPRVGEFPFDFRLRYMVTFHRQENGKQFVAVKGAPRQILEMCQSTLRDGLIVPFTDADKDQVRLAFETMAKKALRGLAMAYAESDQDLRTLGPQNLKHHLIFLGLFGLRDPIRAEAPEAVSQIQRAGIHLLMLTGDYRVTAEAVARDIGLLRATDPQALIDGQEIASLRDDQLRDRLPQLRVASRVSPEDKYRIARLLQERGEVVAMTGDGINDVPALARADVGIAIGGSATDAAKEASDMIVTDGNLSSIVHAVGEGRTIYRNIQRVLLYLLASNFAELFLILLALFAGLPLPLLPTQIIWLNAVTDPFLGLALAREPRKDTVLEEPPRPVRQPIISEGHWLRIGLVALTIALSSFVLFYVELSRGASPRHLFALTLTTVALGEWFSAFVFRSSRRSLFSMFGTNRTLWPTLLIVVLMQCAILYVPSLARLFHVAPLSLTDWLLALAFSLPVVFVDELRKLIVRRGKAKGATP